MTRIVVDSTSDLPTATMEELGIIMVPLKVHFGTEDFLDRVELEQDEFFTKLGEASELPKTSQPSPGQFVEAYKRVPEGETILSIHVSEKLSGTCQSARLAAKELPGRDIRVIDTGNVTAASGLLILVAAEMVQAGKSPDEVESALVEMSGRTRLLAILDTLKYAVMGGRVSKVQGALGGLLRVKAVMLIYDGDIDRLPPARTWGQAFQKVVEDITAHGGAERISVVDAQAPGSRAELHAVLEQNFPGVPITEGALGAVIGTHAGPGAVGCAYIAKKAG
ncbi:MAG TPA: DegV family protein [Candidatus Dormibacteraeota bacterium]|nr:DegV family protein [Candidatus Dormibacteraeota bacterium]